MAKTLEELITYLQNYLEENPDDKDKEVYIDVWGMHYPLNEITKYKGELFV